MPRQTNAYRQKKYRDRKRNARNAPVPPISVTRTGGGKDFWRDGQEHIFIGNFGYGDRYALVVHKKAE